MRLFVLADGAAGFALREDGELTGAFSRKGSARAPDGRSRFHQLMVLAVEQGATHLDCFNTVLPRLYSLFGFRPVARLAWDDAFAPDGWDNQAFALFNNGEPDVVFMVWDGGDRATLHARVGSFDFPGPGEAPLAATPEEARRLQALALA